MKIAFIVYQFPALSETFILNQITGILDRGHEVDIFTGTSPDYPKVHSDVDRYNLLSRTYCEERPDNKFWRLLKATGLLLTNFHKAPGLILKSLNFFKLGRKGLALWYFYRILPFLDKEPYDIIHCHFGPLGEFGIALNAATGGQAKIVVSLHGFDLSLYFREQGEDIYKSLFDQADLFLPISEHWRQKLIALGYDSQKIMVHKMGVDTKKFPFSIRSKGGATEILTVGRLIEKKGIRYGIQAVAKLLEEHPAINYRIAGDGPLREELNNMIEQLGVGDRIKLSGWQAQGEIAELMGCAHILLAPSVTSSDGDQEGIPVVLMEALARGLPVLTTYHSGIPELVQDGVSGFLVSERDPDALVTKLKFFLEHPEIWREMGKAGRRHVEEHHDITRLTGKLIEIYEALI